MLRFGNTLAALFCVVIGFKLSQTVETDALNWVLALATTGFIFMGGNALNDYLDREIDKSAHPSRPIPAGFLKPQSVKKIAYLFFGAGIILSILTVFLGYLIPGLISLLSALILISYDYYLKKIPLAGNITIGILGALVFIYSGAFTSICFKHIFAGVFAMLFHIAREIVKDIADAPYEKALGIKTLPSKIGLERSSKISSTLLILIVPISIIPFFLKIFSIWYLGVVILFADLPILLISWIIPQSTTPRRAEKISRDLKWVMLSGLFALYIGGITS